MATRNMEPSVARQDPFHSLAREREPPLDP